MGRIYEYWGGGYATRAGKFIENPPYGMGDVKNKFTTGKQPAPNSCQRASQDRCLRDTFQDTTSW